MSGDVILSKVYDWLGAATRGEARLSPEQVAEYASLSATAMNRFNEKRDDKFRIRMSAIGRPVCQQQMHKMDIPKEASEANLAMRLTIGDCLEAAVIVMLKAAGVNVTHQDQKCSAEVGGITINGTFDIAIDNGIYDIKTASPYVFKYKYTDFESLRANDSFGYILQAAMYEEATGMPFKGWIFIDKASGEWRIIETPPDEWATIQAEEIAKADARIRILNNDKAEFVRSFEDIEEEFRKKKTGNRKLGTECGFCSYKWECWPGLKHLPSLSSAARDPAMVYYTSILPENYKDDGDSDA